MLGCFVYAIACSHASAEVSATNDPDDLSCRITSVKGGEILATVKNDEGTECYVIKWDEPEPMITIMDAYLTEYYRGPSDGWEWDAENYMLFSEKEDGTMIFIYVPVLISLK